MCSAASRRPTSWELTDSNRNLSNSGHWLFPSSSRRETKTIHVHLCSKNIIHGKIHGDLWCVHTYQWGCGRAQLLCRRPSCGCLAGSPVECWSAAPSWWRPAATPSNPGRSPRRTTTAAVAGAPLPSVWPEITKPQFQLPISKNPFRPSSCREFF